MPPTAVWMLALVITRESKLLLPALSLNRLSQSQPCHQKVKNTLQFVNVSDLCWDSDQLSAQQFPLQYLSAAGVQPASGRRSTCSLIQGPLSEPRGVLVRTGCTFCRSVRPPNRQTFMCDACTDETQLTSSHRPVLQHQTPGWHRRTEPWKNILLLI